MMSLVQKRIRAGFEPSRVIGLPFPFLTTKKRPDQSDIGGDTTSPNAAQNRRDEVHPASRTTRTPSFSPYPFAISPYAVSCLC